MAEQENNNSNNTLLENSDNVFFEDVEDE